MIAKKENTSYPILSIGMPVFNDVLFIEESLCSILNQTFTNFELIISDDGSTDGSEEICRRYAFKDKRIRYIRQPLNLGISKNMQFLLNQSKAKYFMWAADDDLWMPNFAKELIDLLENNQESISAFCNYKIIDEEGNSYTEAVISKDYRNSKKTSRIKNFIKESDDGFGYGIFVRSKIHEVEFPVWWWPNKKTPYNNIFPTLCYYLAQGDFILFDNDVLFFKRDKGLKNTNHLLTGSGNGLKETAAFIIRRINLIVFSAKLIRKSSGIMLMFAVLSTLFYHWVIISSVQQIKLATKALLKQLWK